VKVSLKMEVAAAQEVSAVARWHYCTHQTSREVRALR
jgi:hypothetical protein